MRNFYSSLFDWKFNLDPETKYGIVEVAGGIGGAVGQLQFDVLLDRLEREYGVSARLETLPFHCARWVTGPFPAIEKVSTSYGRRQVEDTDGAPLILFDNEWTLQRSVEQEKSLTFHDVQPRGPSADGNRASTPSHAT